MSDLFTSVAEIISQIRGIDIKTITLNSHLMTDLQVDSLDFLDITYEIDKKYQISIPIEDWMAQANEQGDTSHLFTMSNLLEKVQLLIDEKQK